MMTVRISRHKKRPSGTGAVALLEEAFCLVRRASARALCSYLLGTLPFVFAALVFFDRRTGVAGDAGLASESLALSFLYLWMKYWQSAYARRLLAGLRNSRPETVSPAGPAQVQTALQPWSFLVLPLALLLAIPFGWCYAFFQNITVLAAEGDLGAVVGKAYRQALLSPGQNLLVILIFLLLSGAVFANLCLAAAILPLLLNRLLGIETAFSRSFHVLFSPSFLAFLAALTYLCLDPFVKAAYVLRCFYGECRETGADLLTELRALPRAAGRTGAALLLAWFLAVGAALPAGAASPAVSAHAPAPSSAEARVLDRAIAEVLKRPEFCPPAPRGHAGGNTQRVPGVFTSLGDTLKDWARQIGRWIGRFLEWLAEHLPKPSGKGGASVGNGDGAWTVPLFMYGLLSVLLSVCGVTLWRRVRGRKPGETPVPAPARVPVPDLRDEAVAPDELSGDGWQQLAGELLAAGEARLAVRALYFASIARLAEAGLVTMDRTKSDRDYERELGRRVHTRPFLREAFSHNVSLFQRSWYGMHPADGEMVDTCLENCRRISSDEP